MRRVIEFRTFADDVVTARNQDFKLPETYTWIRTGHGYQMASNALYALFSLGASGWLRHGLHTRFIGQERLAREAQGYFLYINHTQTTGDPFLPSQLARTRRAYVVASPSNLSVPFFGKLLPMLGALPLPSTRQGMKEFRKAIAYRVGQNQSVAIFPEAHVWPYYTGIRPFSDTSFQFAVDTGKPVYCATVTYQRGRRGRVERTVFVDGPFYPDDTLSRPAKRRKLAEQVYCQMRKNAKKNTVEVIRYVQRKEEA